MFGTNHTTVAPSGGGRPQAGDVAKIEGGLTHVFLLNEAGADSLYAYHNGRMLSAGQIDSLSVVIEVPAEGSQGTLTAVLTYFETGADGARANKSASLFPGTVEVIGKGKKLTVICAEEGSFDSLALRIGTAPILDEQGVLTTGLPVFGVQSLRVTVAPGLADGRLVWSEDGREDVIFG